MALNAKPIWKGKPVIGWNTTNITAANTTTDGASGTKYDIFTADATNGGLARTAVIVPKGTNVATVMRFWLNNGSADTTAANNTLIGEVTCPATTVSQVAALNSIPFAINEDLPLGYKIFVTIGTAVAAGFSVTLYAGDYTPS